MMGAVVRAFCYVALFGLGAYIGAISNHEVAAGRPQVEPVGPCRMR